MEDDFDRRKIEAQVVLQAADPFQAADFSSREAGATAGKAPGAYELGLFAQLKHLQ
jgi:hypothetical protein